MLQDKRIGIIGAGAVGSAICHGLVRAEAAPANRIVVYDTDPAKTQALHEQVGIKIADTSIQVAKFTDLIVLALERDASDATLEEIRDVLKRDGGKPQPLVLSLIPNLTLTVLNAAIGGAVPTSRAAVGLSASLGTSDSLYSLSDSADENYAGQVRAFLEALGTAIQVPEHALATAVSYAQALPAAHYLLLEAMISGGVRSGLPYVAATQIAARTMREAAQSASETELHLSTLRDLSAPPASGMLELLADLERASVRAALSDAITDALSLIPEA